MMEVRPSHLLPFDPGARTLACIAVLLLLGAPAPGWAQEGVPGAPGGEGAPAEPPPPPKANPEVVKKLRLQFEREPPVQEVQKAALTFFRVHPEIIQGYRNGASYKALVPEFEVSFNTDRTDNARNLIDAIYQKAYPIKERESQLNTHFSLGLRAHWYLDRLVFNAEVLDVTSLVGVQEGLLREITSLYFTRRRLVTMFAINPPQDPGEQITETIRVDEISANLDALTGGFFSKAIEKSTAQ